MTAAPPEAASPHWDAIAASLASQANAISFGAVIVAVIVAVAGIGWGVIITRNAEREAKNEARIVAEAEAKKWLSEEGIPFLRRAMEEWGATFPQGKPISEGDLDAMVAAVGADRKEGDDGTK